MVDFAVAFFGILEHLGATGTAAQPLAAAAAHFDEVGVQCLQCGTRRFVLAVAPAEVAGVVEGDPATLEGVAVGDAQAAVVNQLLDCLLYTSPSPRDS